jgi:GntR family transcriptional regulator
LPPERELADQLGISRVTTRQALSYLVQDATLVVRHGVGTFVAEPKRVYDALHLVGFTEGTIRRGHQASSRVLEQDIVDPPLAVTAGLALPAKGQAVKIVRVRSSGDLPLVLETSYVPLDLCPGLVDEDMEVQSLYVLLETRYGLSLQRASQTVEATIANEFEAELFGITAGSPLLLVEGVTYSISDQPIEWFKAVYRADRVSLALDSDRKEPKGERGLSSSIRVVVAPGPAE